MSQPVNLDNKTYGRLKFVKEKGKHRSFSAAVNHVLDAYWSPAMAEIMIEEQFHDLMTWLRTRDLLLGDAGERAEGLLMHAKAKVFEAKKEKRLSSGNKPLF